MKHTKKLFAIALTLIMALALTVPAFAADATQGNSDTTDATNYKQGLITVSNPIPGETYSIYRLLDLESYNKTTGAYAYKVNSDWAGFFAQESIVYDASVAGDTGYVVIDAQGYVTWNGTSSAADFAALALAYAQENKIAAIASKTAPVDNPATEDKDESNVPMAFENVELGYYLMDSSLGTLCALDTTNNEVTVFEKNGVPASDKNVLEDSSNTYGKSNTADIIDTINYQATIVVPGGKTTGATEDSSVNTDYPGAQNFVLHDTLDTELTFGSVTGITLTRDGVTETVDTADYTVKTTDIADDCSFEVVFTQAFCDELEKDDEIVVSYTATFDSAATILSGKAYENDAWLTYGEDGGEHTTVATTQTKTYDVDVFKFHYTGTDDPATADVDERVKTPLAEAEFKLYKMDGEEKVYAKTSAAVEDVYTLIEWTTEANATVFISPADGGFTIHGLDIDTYYLTETEAPDGFNKLAADITVSVDGSGYDKDEDTTVEEGEYAVLVEIENQTGTVLPSTGGIGTTIFYVVGALLMAGAGVLLVTKKRMADEE